MLSSRSDPPDGPRTSSTTLHARTRRLREPLNDDGNEHGINSNGFATHGALGELAKEDGPLDWYHEGPGRRVGYDDLTAIDWIFEYTKERQRLRVLRSQASGFLGTLQQLVDASQVWVILIGTGLTTGLLAAGINVASDWLGDLKTGYCRTGIDGGYFWLNRGFCCWGHEGILLTSM